MMRFSFKILGHVYFSQFSAQKINARIVNVPKNNGIEIKFVNEIEFNAPTDFDFTSNRVTAFYSPSKSRFHHPGAAAKLNFFQHKPDTVINA